MKPWIRETARWVLPRPIRQVLQAPRRTIQWCWEKVQPDTTFSVGPDFRLRCPRLAIEEAYHLQIDDPSQVAEFNDFLKLIQTLKNPVFLDLGCHFGLFGFAVLGLCGPRSKVVAVDASNIACEMTQRVAQLNGWSNRIRVIRAAVGGHTGELEMVSTGIIGAGYFVLPTDQPTRDRIRVPQWSLADLIQQMESPPDLIKLDVESFEAEVISGGISVLRNLSIPLCLEMHHELMKHRGIDPQNVWRQLVDAGYQTFLCAGKEISVESALANDLIRVIARK